MRRTKTPSWVVAAAILILERKSLSLEELTSRVECTKISDLTKRGGITPEQSLRVEIRKQFNYIEAVSVRPSKYRIKDPRSLIRNSEVRSVLVWFLDKLIHEHKTDLDQYRALFESHCGEVRSLLEERDIDSNADTQEGIQRSSNRLFCSQRSVSERHELIEYLSSLVC